MSTVRYTGRDLVRETYDEAVIHDEHFHNRERWFGATTDQTGNDWAEEVSLNMFRAITGTSAFGVDANDEALVFGTDDTPAITGMVWFDLHRIWVDATSNANPYYLRIVYGTGTMTSSEGLGQYTDVPISDARKGGPIPIIMPRRVCGSDKVWIRAKNATNNATIDFLVGSHEYVR